MIISGGIGITPILSVVGKYPDRTIQMFYTAHRKADLIYTEDLNNYQLKMKNFALKSQVGRFKDSEILGQLPNEFQKNTLFLISGPSSMMHHWKRFLRRHGVEPGQMYSEEFTW